MKLKHIVTATVKDRNGKIKQKIVEPNTITDADPASSNNGRVFMLERLFFSSASDTYADATTVYYDPTDYIDTMELGTGTASNSGLGVAVSPSTVESIVSVTRDYATLANPNVTVQVDWDSTYPALSGVVEVVLLNTGGDIIAYKNLSTALSKGTGDTLSITWEVGLS